MGVVTRGDREISARFETFPARARQKIAERIRSLTAALEARVRAAAPVRTGLLRSEIKLSIYDSENQNRVAGYVSVYAGGRSQEYAKAATLEYGSNKPRKLADKSSKSIEGLFSRTKRMERRLSRSPHIEAFRYLRGPLEEMKPEIEEALDEVLAEVAAEGES